MLGGAGASFGVCNTGDSDTGLSAAALLMEAAVIAVAGYQTAVAIDLADKQYDIAKQYLDIAKWWRNYYNSAYRPVEDQELKEAWALEEEKPQYDVAIGRTRTFGRLQFRGLAEKSIQCTSEYCTGLREALLKDVMTSEATALAALSNLGYRNERAYVEARNDERWERLLATVRRGRNMIAGNIQFSQLSFGIFGDLGKQAAQGAAGAVRYLGYRWNRNETEYPTLMRGIAQQPQQQPAQEPASAPAYQQPTMRSGVVFDGSGPGRATR